MPEPTHRPVAAAAGGPPADRDLIALGRFASILEGRLDAYEAKDDTREVEEIPGLAELMETHANALARIAAMPAHTLKGYRVKAQRIAHLRKDQPDLLKMHDGSQPDADIMLALSIVRDVLAATD